jgi:hypothetical protein
MQFSSTNTGLSGSAMNDVSIAVGEEKLLQMKAIIKASKQ